MAVGGLGVLVALEVDVALVLGAHLTAQEAGVLQGVLQGFGIGS